MRQNSRVPCVMIALLVAFAGGVVPVLAGDGAVAGSFAVNNHLPAGWDLTAVLMEEGSTAALASHPATAAGGSVAFSFADLDPGSYRVRLVASKDETVLGLSETSALEVSAEPSESLSDAWKAIGAGGTVSGEIELSGQPPEERMILIRVRRVDIDLEGQFPDQLNAFTVEVQKGEIEAGRVAYEMSGLSYGLYAVELIAYHYETHTTQPIGAHPERFVVDLDHEEYEAINFAVSF